MINKPQARAIVREIIAAYERGDSNDTIEYILRATLLGMTVHAAQQGLDKLDGKEKTRRWTVR